MDWRYSPLFARSSSRILLRSFQARRRFHRTNCPMSSFIFLPGFDDLGIGLASSFLRLSPGSCLRSCFSIRAPPVFWKLSWISHQRDPAITILQGHFSRQAKAGTVKRRRS